MKNKLFLFLAAFTILFSCEKDTIYTKKYNVSGMAQKGPFVIGTNVTIYELDNELNPTGKSYYTTISDNNGTFEIPNVEFSSSYVKLVADGTYFNEVNGMIGDERLTLTSIANLEDSSSININILTHLESERLQYILKNEGRTFEEAKIQTRNEVLAIFHLNAGSTRNFEQLNITQSGEDNAKLLAVSAIMIGNWTRSISDQTELFTYIKSDIKTDGVLDNEDIIYDLKLHAELLRFNNIENNLKNRYNLDNISEFQQMINYYLDNSETQTNLSITVPESTDKGINLLSLPNSSSINESSEFCLASNVHYVHAQDSITYYVSLEKDDGIMWNFTTENTTSIDGWSYKVWENSIGFELKGRDKLCEIPIELSGKGKLLLNIQIQALKTGSTSVTREITLE